MNIGFYHEGEYYSYTDKDILLEDFREANRSDTNHARVFRRKMFEALLAAVPVHDTVNK